MRWRGVLGGAACAAVLQAAPSAAGEAFSNLRWSADGRRVELQAGPADARRTLSVDVATGAVECLDPHVQEPAIAGRTLVFRDVFGVFALDLADGARPRLAFWLPASGPEFLRAAGVDARGRILAWTYDRAAGRHAIRTATAGEGAAAAVEPQGGGPEALRAWRARNVAIAFEPVLHRFVRSHCVRRAAHETRLCVEEVPGSGGATWRLTLGAPGNVQQLVESCRPVAFALQPDSSHALVAVVEPIDGQPALATWVVTWSAGRRLGSIPALGPSNDAASWVHWDGDTALWADARGGLSRLDLAGQAARTLVDAPTVHAPARIWTIVAPATREAAESEALQARLASAAPEAAVVERPDGFEVQAGVAASRQAGQARAAALRQQGFAGLRVEARAASDVAPGIAYGHATGAGGKSAWARRMDTAAGNGCELWVEEPGKVARLVFGDPVRR